MIMARKIRSAELENRGIAKGIRLGDAEVRHYCSAMVLVGAPSVPLPSKCVVPKVFRRCRRWMPQACEIARNRGAGDSDGRPPRQNFAVRRRLRSSHR
jgi:hypothetical protein